MGLFSTNKGLDRVPVLANGTICLRAPTLEDYAAWAKLRGESRAFLEPWEPRWLADELTKTRFRDQILHYHRRATEDHTYPFYIFRTKDQALLGGITVFNIRRGIAQMGTLGYWLGQDHTGQGYMRQALDLVLQHSFTTLHLHRVEAACLPRNLPSQRLLAGAGFMPEGLAQSYLQIAGIWEDHLLFAKVTHLK